MSSFWKMILSYPLLKVKEGYAVFAGMNRDQKITCAGCYAIGYCIGKFL